MILSRRRKLLYSAVAFLLWMLAGTSVAQTWYVVGSGPDPAGYTIYPTDSITKKPSVMEVLVPDVVEKAAFECRRGGVERTLVGKGDAPHLELDVRIANENLGRVLRVEVGGLPETASAAGLSSRLQSGLKTLLESEEGRSKLGRCLKEGTLPVAQAAVRDALPRTFDEMLALHYGFSADRRHIDLRPGMRLCVDFAEGDRSGSQKLLRGGSRVCLPVGAGRGATGVGFSPLLDRFDRLDVSTQEINGLHWITGPADLSTATKSRRFYRLFYSDKIQRQEGLFPDEDQKLKAEDRPLLVAVDSIEDRNLATDCRAAEGLFALCQGEPTCSDFPDREMKKTPFCYLFRDWGVPIPEISVRLKGEWVWVPLGTTVIDLLDRHGNLGWRELASIDGADKIVAARAGRWVNKMKIQRHFRGSRVDIGFRSQNGLGALFLPLFQGDEIEWPD